jgi:hypothetical protein
MCIVTGQTPPLHHWLVCIGHGRLLLMTIETKCGQLIHQPETQAIRRRMRGPGRFMAIVAGILGRIVHDLVLHQVFMAFDARGTFVRPPERETEAYEKFYNKQLDHGLWLNEIRIDV